MKTNIMITREEYNKALDIVEAYQKQLFIGGVTNSLRDEKTTIANWEGLKDCNKRLRNNIGNITEYKDGKLQEIKYVEDISRFNFNKTEGLGKKSWREFVYLRGY